ncbi:hypothetical protein GH714_011807 [Hevea brasiliensis]|uniref:Uncharacterized protein n=1 Tax=Hevea brasiliensis TaxID=3981 RepID=A0A6A6MXL0_HEVBR|nr:hypothetical protein GH714_011807 [Hevea brasiliensis]
MRACEFEAIYNLGDSISDTGNLIQEDPASVFSRFPYGQNLYVNPTGRCSNGLLIIDFIDCVEKHRKSLFMVGEIGGNDYNYAFFQGKTIDDLKTMVPDVVKAIKDAVVQAIKELQEDHSNVTIVYGDYYNAYKWILWKAALLGFDPKSLQKACCGSGGDYDFSLATMCGAPNVPVCPKPGERISWDGVHSTEKAYFFMAGWLIRDIFQKLQCIV